MRRRTTGTTFVWSSVFAVLALHGCNRSRSEQPQKPIAPATPPSGSNAPAAIVVGGDRPTDVYVPSSYRPGTKMPLVLLLHGYTASGAAQEFYFKLKPLAETRGFLYAFPDGTANKEGKRFWNATDACCDLDQSRVDDAKYLRGLIEEIAAHWSVDRKRIFLAGHSNGGFMAHRMACDHADLIAAVASLAGSTFVDRARCQPSVPVSVLQIHGTADDVIKYEGGSFYGRSYPSAHATVERWVELDGCDPHADNGGAHLDLDGNVPGAESVVTRYRKCRDGADVALYTIPGGSHLPQPTPTLATAVVDFLLAHPKP